MKQKQKNGWSDDEIIEDLAEHDGGEYATPISYAEWRRANPDLRPKRKITPSPKKTPFQERHPSRKFWPEFSKAGCLVMTILVIVLYVALRALVAM